jgi:hypothetical protein
MKSAARMRGFLSLLAALASTQLCAQGHCSLGETTYFSCRIKNSENYVSLCGSTSLVAENDELNTNGWLQYRFGKTGQLKQVFPREKKNSLRRFSGDYESHKAGGIFWYDLHFKARDADYQLGIGFGDQGGYYGVDIRRHKELTELSCADVSVERFKSDGDSNSQFPALVRALKPE